MVKNMLPPGFRFHPTDVELVQYYLRRKVMNKPLLLDAIAVVDIYKLSPWDLPGKSSLKSRDLEWYFFCPRDRKYANGPRTNRATETGYWKTTGKDRSVSHKSRIVGMKKTLVFHTGRAPKGARTDWVMHEYRLEDKEVADAGYLLDAYVLCRIFEKSGPGPKNGEQYGAPFYDEEWEEDETKDVNHGQLTSCLEPDGLVSPSVQNHIEVGSSSHAPLINDGSNQTVFPKGNTSEVLADEQESSFPEGRELEELLMEITDQDGDAPSLDQNLPTTETSYWGEGYAMYERSSAIHDGSEIYEGLEEIAPHEELGRFYYSNCPLDDPESYGYMEASDFMSSGQTDQTQFGTSTMFHPYEGLDGALLSDFEATGGDGYSHSEFDQNGASSVTPQDVDFEHELQSLHHIPLEDFR